MPLSLSHLRYFFFAAFIVFLISCKKDGADVQDNTTHGTFPDQPSQFKFIGLKKYNDRKVDISWSAAKSGIADTSVKYTVNLSGSLRAYNLKDTVYTLTNIFPTLTYTGEVIATNNKGVSAKVTFIINAEKTFVYGNSSGNMFSCYALNGLHVWDLSINAQAMTAISNDTLFAQAIQISTGRREIFAIDTKTGKTDWEVPDPIPYYRDATEILYDNGIIYEVGPHIYAFDAHTGQLLWNKNNYVLNRPAVGAGILFCIDSDTANNEFLIAYDGRTGVEIWRYKTHGETFGLPAVYDGVVYLVLSHPTANWSGRPLATLYAFDQQTGSQRWNCSFLGSVGFEGQQSRPMLIGNSLFVSVINFELEDNNLLAINRTDGQLIWQKHYVPAYLFGNADGLYIDAGLNGITKISPLTGEVIWDFRTNSFNLPDLWIFTPEHLIAHASFNTYGPKPFKVYDTATGRPDITSLLNINMTGSFVIIDNGKPCYAPETGVLK
jgi:outer membrane protein assembly factor BamB